MKKLLILTSALCCVGMAFADDDNDNKNNGLQAVPFTFVGTAPGCAPGAAGSNIVTSAWLTGMGLPDNGGSNTATDAATKNDPHFGLLVSKNGLTADCSSAGATIQGAGSITTTATTEFGFDYRNGGHCGAGAPRFNVTTSDNTTHFLGCAGGTTTPAPQDPAQWSRVRFTPAMAFPPILPGSTIKSISIVYDEGTDSASANDPNGVGLAAIDNIDVNGTLITRGNGNGDNDNDKDKGKKDN
jgi:hypothetical protein